MVKISVIVPCYNVEEYLEECLDSIVNQTFKDIEIICINDGSTDNTLDILNSYAQKDTRIKIISQSNQGLSAARNAGLKSINGEYVTFIDSDDYFELTAFEEIFNIMEEKSLDLLLFKLINFDEESYEKSTWHYFEMNFVKNIVGDNIFNQEDIGETFYYMSVTAPGKLYKSDLIDGMEFPEGLIFEDNPFFVEVMFRAKRIYFYDRYLYYRRIRTDSITQSSTHNFYHTIDIHNMITDITKRYGYFEKYQTRLYRKKIASIHWYFKLVNEEDKEFYFERMQEDYKKFEKEYKSSEAFYELPNRFQNHYNFGIECESYHEYQLKTENVDIIEDIKEENVEFNEQNNMLKKKNKKLKKEIKSFKKFNKLILDSRSWKITEPLRKLMNIFR